MKIVVRSNSRIDFTLSVEDNQTVLELKEMLEKKTRIKVDEMFLSHRGRLLYDEAELGTCNFKEMDMVIMNIRLLSCKKCSC
ncbi:hypothetical protein GCK72_025450 [Caenorhabditis remanei]|uniref:Ubiquitin-like domain-containing protein n=1 Tax=Caenorhabditis remanei TaxID=31234 RepID=E3MJI4_CAERE|nr:hypothetical protein GCK72_025450 [Caenorhabditis remanei]EFP03694.1 hypothetical protein CRE_19222 [Caenorhabditis remanei]KAF1748983.1 hypothetical protein GCK72_025450 [Caenorhabditis remanei]